MKMTNIQSVNQTKLFIVLVFFKFPEGFTVLIDGTVKLHDT